MHIPQNLQYSKDHIWVRLSGHSATLGITAFAQSELGDIVYVDIEKANKEVTQNDIFGNLEAVKTTSDLFTPIPGKVVAVNAKLEDDPTLINTDPYGDGWIIKMDVKNKPQPNDLLSAEVYKQLIAQ